MAAEAADVEALPVGEKYKALLRLCMKLTQHAYKVTDEDIDALRGEGLSDDEILEGVFVACQFNPSTGSPTRSGSTSSCNCANSNSAKRTQ